VDSFRQSIDLFWFDSSVYKRFVWWIRFVTQFSKDSFSIGRVHFYPPSPHPPLCAPMQEHVVTWYVGMFQYTLVHVLCNLYNGRPVSIRGLYSQDQSRSRSRFLDMSRQTFKKCRDFLNGLRCPFLNYRDLNKKQLKAFLNCHDFLVQCFLTKQQPGKKLFFIVDKYIQRLNSRGMK
jgi:hypothetical protein